MPKRNLTKLRDSLSGAARTNPGAGLAVEPSALIVSSYRKQMLNRVSKPFWRDVNRLLIPHLEFLEPQYSKKLLENVDPVNSALGVLARIEGIWGNIGPTAENLATKWAEETQEFHREKFLDYLGAIGVNIKSILTDEGLEQAFDAAVKDNFDLITSIPEKNVERIRKRMIEGIQRGNDFRSLKNEIREIEKTIDPNRVKLIARDQSSKFNGTLNRVRQEDVGINAYYWRTSSDGPPRVRDTHWANRNKRFLWSKPPAKTGHPGEDVNCRCYADPDLRGLRLR